MKAIISQILRGGGRTLSYLAAAFFALGFAQTAQAGLFKWTGASDNKWSTTGNWSKSGSYGSRTLPTNDDELYNKSNFNSKFTSATISFDGAKTNSFKTTISNVGNSSAPLVFQGTSAANGLTTGDNANEGIFIANGTASSSYNTGDAYVKFGTGTFATGSSAVWRIGDGTRSGYVTVAGATVKTTSGSFYLHKGSLTLDSGSVTVNSGDLSIGNNGASTVTVNGGTLHVGYWTKFEKTSNAKTINLNGGTLKTYTIANDGGTGAMTVLFNGGTLYATATHNTHGLIDPGITAKVGAKGGTINAGGRNAYILADMVDGDSSPGSLKFCGGGSVAFTNSASVAYTGGTIIEAGTKIFVNNATKKDAILGHGLNTLKFIPTTDGTFTLVTITGDGTFSDSDLLKVAVAPGAAGTAEFSLSNDRKSLIATVTFGVINQSSPTLVFPGATLADLSTHTLRARMKGDDFDADGTEVTFFNRTETEDGGVLAKVTYQLQAIDELSDQHWTKAAKVEFTADTDGVYAKLIDGDYSNYDTPAKFGTDPLTANSGTSNYIPYDFRLVEPATAISVNFTQGGKNLDSSSSVRYGAGDYAVPYSSWNNMAGANNGTATYGGATIKITKTSGGFYCNKLSDTKDLRRGYLDDGGNSVVIDVTNIPYEFYRIVTYHATDNANVTFGYVKINETRYTGITDATVKGDAVWGATASSHYAFGFREGVNYLVSDVMSGSSATITGHKVSPARGCIAAIQIVEYVPTTYTATIGDGGAKTFSALDWDKTLPAALTAGDQVVLNVNEDTTLTLDSALDVYAIRFNVAEGKTLTLAGSNVLAQYITATGLGHTVVASASQLSGTVKGDGTLVYTAAPSGITLTDNQWSGVLWLKNCAIVGLVPANMASDNSTLRLTGVTGYFNTGDNTSTCPGTLDLQDDGATNAFVVNNGYSTGGITVFAKLTGDGTLGVADRDIAQRYVFKDVAGFTGTFNIASRPLRVILGDGASLSPANGTITVVAGTTATVAAGKTWTANQGGIVVNGTLNLGAGATAPAVAGGTGTVAVASGTGTLNGYGPGAVLTLATAPGATLAVSDGTLTSMTVGAFNNLGTIDLTGTALTEARLNLASGVTTAATGTILYPATFEKFVVSPDDQTVRSLAAFTTLPTLPAGAAYYVQVAETREEYGKGSLVVTDAASGVNVRVARPDGTFTDVVPVDGTATLVGVHIAGASTVFDFTYTNTAEKAYSAPGYSIDWNADTKPVTFNNANADKTTGAYIKHHPWVTGAGNLVHDLENFTIVLVGTMSPSHNTQFFHMGTTGDTEAQTGLLITTTENDNEVLIAKNAGAAVDAAGGVRAAVSNAATARHVYVIYKKGTVFEVWVDGVKRGQFNGGEGFTLSAGGMQVGSDHGGKIRNAGIYQGVPVSDEETGCLNVLRMFDYSITDAQAEAVFAEYPYVSQGGLYTRTVAADGTFSEADAWEKDGAAGTFAVPEGVTVNEVYYNPSATLTVSAEATMTVNADVALENLTVGGSAALTFAADGAHTISVVGAAFINSPVTNEYGAVYLAGAPVRLGSSGAICFDCSSLDVSEVYAVTRFQLTGLIARDDEKMSFVPPADPDRSYAIVYNTTGSCYDFVVTPNHDYVVVENLRTALEATDDTIIVGAGGVKVSSLGIPAAGKLMLDPIKTPVYVSAAPTFGEGAKIVLSPDYAGMTLGRVVLLTWTGAATLPENLNSLFDASSVSGSAVVTAETAPNGTSTQLVLTVGDYDRDAKEIRILPVGDSITQGVASSGKGASGQSDYPQYRTAIAARLAANGYKPKMLGVWKRYPWDAAGVTQSSDWIWHSGISAERIITGGERGGVQDNMHVYLDIAGDVNAITFLIGTNDLGAGTPVADTYAAFTNLMFKTATERPNAKIFGSTILDRNEADSENHGNVVAFNALLRADYAAGNLPANFVMLDLFEDIPLTTGAGGNFLSDKLHMNWAGCAIASEKFADAIMAALPLAGAGAISGNPDPTVTDAPQTALGAANVAELADYRSGMTKVYTIDAAATNAFTAAPYTTIDDTSALSRPVLKAGYYMELVRKGTSRRRYVWVDFDAAGKTLGDIDFPWIGANMQFVAEKLHVYSNDPSIHNVAANDDSASGIVEGTWHNYSDTAALADAPADIADKFGWNDTLSTSGNGYGCFQTHRILSETEAEVLFAWNSWGGGRANYADEIGIGSFGKSTTLGKNFSMDYTFTCETSDGAADTLTANAYSVRRVEIWAVFDGEARHGVWTGLGGDNDFDNAANWENGAVPADGAAVDFSALPTNATISVTGASAAKTFGVVTMGENLVTFTGTFKATSFSDTAKVAVGGNSTVTLDGDLEFSGSGDQFVIYSVAAGGKFVVTGDVIAKEDFTGYLFHSKTAGAGAVQARGVANNATSNTDPWAFRLSAGDGTDPANWIIGDHGLFGTKGLWTNGSRPISLRPLDANFTITASVGIYGDCEFNTTGADGNPYTITIGNGSNGHFERTAAVTVTGTGKVLANAANTLSGAVTVTNTATLAINPGKTMTTGAITVAEGATLQVAQSGEVALGGDLTLADGAILGFNFTERRNAPVLAVPGSVTATGTIKVNVTASNSIRPAYGSDGKYTLTSGGKFGGKTVALTDDSKKLAASVAIENNEIVLSVKPAGTIFFVK